MDRLEIVKEKKRKTKAPKQTLKTNKALAQDLGQGRAEIQQRNAQNSGQTADETHGKCAQTSDQLRIETQHDGVQPLVDHLIRECRRRNQFMRAHLALKQQRESLHMMILHENHIGIEGAMDKKRPWKCLLCEKHRKEGNGKDHAPFETQKRYVDKENGHSDSEIHTSAADKENGQAKNETHSSFADAILFGPFDESIALIEAPRRDFEKRIETLAKHLPVWKWAEKVRGIGPSILGQVIGESGNLSNYANPGKLWKRFGLEPGAKRVRAVATQSQSAEERRTLATQLGYSPRRRALMHVVGECLLRASGEYYDVYASRKAYEEGQHPDWIGDKKKHPGHLHKRAMRYMEKRFLRDLWMQWNGATDPWKPNENSANVGMKSTSRLPNKARL